MPQYCVDAHAEEYGDRAVHDLTCSHLPPAEDQELLGWHRNVRSAIARARLWYKAARPCIHCCAEAASRVRAG